ncbi:hypothetical protein [Actinomadura sp. 6N118]|uniref:hypothetical protein n=1 Tax=Actinomadura sp. 6N118 TaxID=3375151 RepID=UPI0037B18956
MDASDDHAVAVSEAVSFIEKVWPVASRLETAGNEALRPVERLDLVQVASRLHLLADVLVRAAGGDSTFSIEVAGFALDDEARQAYPHGLWPDARE